MGGPCSYHEHQRASVAVSGGVIGSHLCISSELDIYIRSRTGHSEMYIDRTTGRRQARTWSSSWEGGYTKLLCRVITVAGPIL